MRHNDISRKSQRRTYYDDASSAALRGMTLL